MSAATGGLTLVVTAPVAGAETYELELMDAGGKVAQGEFAIDRQRVLDGDAGQTWGSFLEKYSAAETGAAALNHFGRALFQRLFGEVDALRDAWQDALGATAKRVVDLTVRLGPHTEGFAGLPLELLHDGEGFVFARPGCRLRRSYRELSEREFVLPKEPRLLFAWACPPGTQSFDPEPHGETLAKCFGERVHRLDQCTLDDLHRALTEARESGHAFEYLHLLVHGFRQGPLGGVCLADRSGALDWVESQRLAQVLQGHGLRFVFLCSCRTAVAGAEAFSGVGQQLLLPHGADVSCVVATQANLPVKGSAQLSGYFYRLLAESGEPSGALAEARRLAFTAGQAWSVPVLLTRPQEHKPEEMVGAEVGGIPPRRPTYLHRPEPEAELAESLARHRLVSLVGLPGVGKTELGQEAARQARKRGLCGKVIYRAVQVDFTVERLRALVGNALGEMELADDEALAACIEARRETLLLVLDNAEDLMRDEGEQDVFSAWLDGLLTATSRLRILLTTRWPAGTVQVNEHRVDVPTLTEEESSTLLRRELETQPGWREEWSAQPSWKRLLDFIDGHPRTLWLISRHFADGHLNPEGMCERLERRKTEALLTPELIGRKDVFQKLSDDARARLKSLVASMDLSFQVVAERHPEAVEAFVALSLFPGGLPEVVAKVVTGGEETLALQKLYHYHLVQWADERTFYPVPLHWYAERQREAHPVEEERIWGLAVVGFAEFAERCDAFLTGGRIKEGVDRLLKEIQTLQKLAELQPRAEHSSDKSQAARLATAVRNGLLLQNRYPLARSLAKVGLQEALHLEDRAGEANCLQGLGDLCLREDDLSGARGYYEEALPLYRAIEARLGEANCLQGLGDLCLREDDLSGARGYYEEALPLYRAIEARLGEANCLQGLGDLCLRDSDLSGARGYYEEALPLYRAIEARLGEANCLQGLGDLCLRDSDLSGARGYYEEALPLYRAIEARLGEANCLQGLGDLCLRDSDLSGARGYYEEALPLYRAIEARLGEANCLQGLGDLCLRDSDLSGARGYYEEALPLYRAIEARLGEANCLQGLGDVFRRTGETAEGNVAYEAAIKLFRAIGNRLGEANVQKGRGLAELASGNAPEAFRRFLELLGIYGEIQERLGQQAALGYLARCARASSALDQAIVLAEASLGIGREAGDRFGQTINLDLQTSIWIEQENFVGAVAGMMIYRDLSLQIRDAAGAERFQPVIEGALSQLPEEVRKVLEDDPETIRRAMVAQAQERMEKDGVELFDVPGGKGG